MNLQQKAEEEDKPYHGHDHGLTAVAIDKDKGSQYALKWAADHLVKKGDTIILLHISNKCSNNDNVNEQQQAQNKELFLPFRCFCTRKSIQCADIVVDNLDVPKGIIEYVRNNGIKNLVLGGSSRSVFLRRFKSTDISATVSKGVPDFCNVYVVAKGKVSSTRTAASTAPPSGPSPHLRQLVTKPSFRSETNHPTVQSVSSTKEETPQASGPMLQETDSLKSPFSRKITKNRSFGDHSFPDTDISFVSSSRTSVDRMFPSLYDHMDSCKTPRVSNASSSFDQSFDSSPSDHSFRMSMESSEGWSSNEMEDIEAEMKRLKLELKQTMDMYSTACKEALSAKQKVHALHRWKVEEEHRLEEARLAGESAVAILEKEKAKTRAAMEAAEASKKIAEQEAQKRINAEMRALKAAEERKKAMDALAHIAVKYRKYAIEEIETATEHFAESHKIGKGCYGPVYKCHLDRKLVAVKVLRPDAAQERSQFQEEAEVLSCMRHPNVVLLLGACPDHGCLVYEYMAKGSLEDCLFRKQNSTVLPWQLRFQIAAEVATGLLFLHQAKPEPIVLRDLKPANILIDQKYVSKISNVGLSRFLPQNVVENMTQQNTASAAAVFCYIDPEYQQTGMLCTKSDVYSLGVILLQMITAKPPMDLAHQMQDAIEKGTFEEMLDPSVSDWPIEETLYFAKLSIKCTGQIQKDRPDLEQVILPELERLRDLGEKNMPFSMLGGENITSNQP